MFDSCVHEEAHWLADAYDAYFSSGLYASRYPAPNPYVLNVLHDVVDELDGRGRPIEVLDFGCGDGRYAVALLDSRPVRMTGYDISRVALDRCARRAAAHVASGRLALLGGDMEELRIRYRSGGPQLSMLMFGVIGHVRFRAERRRVLSTLAAIMGPGGRLVVSVPNRARRMLAEQRKTPSHHEGVPLEPDDVLYTRSRGGVTIPLFYHLYTLDELREDLRASGFVIGPIVPESVLTEHRVLVSGLGRRAEGWLRKIAPLRWAYGFLAVARVA